MGHARIRGFTAKQSTDISNLHREHENEILALTLEHSTQVGGLKEEIEHLKGEIEQVKDAHEREIFLKVEEVVRKASYMEEVLQRGHDSAILALQVVHGPFNVSRLNFNSVYEQPMDFNITNPYKLFWTTFVLKNKSYVIPPISEHSLLMKLTKLPTFIVDYLFTF
ncbi:hypothetical protein V6N13_124884 [Hibiscus sabdariffa]|uniref:Uncharacterized protein n=1 Tax=Hibiscus sabdariffa TaxID=183260 RepID=A0ABR2U482_9ROSI